MPMGLSNDYVTEPADEDVAGSDDDEGIDDEQYQWLQEQLAHIGHLRIEEEEEEEEWVDPSGGLLLNIFEACETGNVDKLLTNLADLAATDHGIDTPGPDGDTALHLACLYGHKACVDQLVQAGCRLDPINAEDRTSPLHDAAAGGHLDIVQLLVTKTGGSTVKLQDADGDTALHNAARGGHLAVVKHLLQHGADVAVTNSSGKTPAAEAEDPTVVAALVMAAREQQQQQQQQVPQVPQQQLQELQLQQRQPQQQEAGLTGAAAARGSDGGGEVADA